MPVWDDARMHKVVADLTEIRDGVIAIQMHNEDLVNQITDLRESVQVERGINRDLMGLLTQVYRLTYQCEVTPTCVGDAVMDVLYHVNELLDEHGIEHGGN